MTFSDDAGDVTRFMLSLVEDPKKLAEYRRDPQATIEAAELRHGAVELLRTKTLAGDSVIVIILVIIVVV
jgi:hypothetical protein